MDHTTAGSSGNHPMKEEVAKKKQVLIAQRQMRLIENQQVDGSNPSQDTGSAISLQDIAVNAASGNIPTGYHGAEKRSGTESPQKEVPFKLSRDYTFDEEGFED